MQLDIEVRLVFNTSKARVRSGYYEVVQETEFKSAVQNSAAMQFNATLTQLPFTLYLIGFILIIIMTQQQNSRNIHVFGVHDLTCMYQPR